MLRTITTTTITTTTAASGFVPSFLIKAAVAYALLNSGTREITTEATMIFSRGSLGRLGIGIEVSGT